MTSLQFSLVAKDDDDDDGDDGSGGAGGGDIGTLEMVSFLANFEFIEFIPTMGLWWLSSPMFSRRPAVLGLIVVAGGSMKVVLVLVGLFGGSMETLSY